MSAMHKADNPTAPEFVAYLTNNGQRAAFAPNGSAAIDPKEDINDHLAATRGAKKTRPYVFVATA
jgi:hypothetical protein